VLFENNAWNINAMTGGTTYFARGVSYGRKMFMKSTTGLIVSLHVS